MDDSHTELYEMLSAIVRGLSKNRDKATVTIDTEFRRVTCRVVVSEEDIGTLIGKQGRTARLIRSLVAVYAAKVQQSVAVDFAIR